MGERTGFRRTWFKGKPEILGTFVCRNDSDFEFSALWNGENWIKDGYVINGVTEWTSVSLVGEEVIETCKDTDDCTKYPERHSTLVDAKHCYLNPVRTPESMKADTIRERTGSIKSTNIVNSSGDINDFDARQFVESRGGRMSDSDLKNFKHLSNASEQEMLFARPVNGQDIRTISGELGRLRELNKLYTELENQSKKLLTNINGCPYLLCEPETDKLPVLGLAEEMAICNDILYARYYGIKENLEIIKNLIG